MRNLHLGLYTPNQGVPKHSGSLFHSTRAVTEKNLEEEFGVAMNEELEREVFSITFLNSSTVIPASSAASSIVTRPSCSFQQIKLLKNNSSCKKAFSYRSFSQLTILYHTHQCNIMGNFAFLKFNPCRSVYPRTAARQIRSYGFSAENPSALAIGAQYLNVSPIMETLVFACRFLIPKASR